MGASNGEIRTWADLADFTRTHGDGEWLFRGVADAVNHDLIPKVARPSLLKGDASPEERPYNREEEEYYFLMFVRQARPHVVPTPAHLRPLAIRIHQCAGARAVNWRQAPAKLLGLLRAPLPIDRLPGVSGSGRRAQCR